MTLEDTDKVQNRGRATTALEFTGALAKDVQYLAGVGPRRGEVLHGIGVHSCYDLLRYYPRRHLDRSVVVPIRDLKEDLGAVTVVGEVRATGTVPGRRKRFEVLITDESGSMKCVWFNGIRWISSVFENGDRVAFHGQPARYGRTFSMAHPDFDKLGEEGGALDTGRIISLYPGSAVLQRVGLTSRQFRRIIFNLFKEHGEDIPEILPHAIRESHALMDGNVALRAIHFPRDHDELKAATKRLKFEELFFMQLLIALNKQETVEKRAGFVFDGPDERRAAFRESLPFELTGDQKKTIAEIESDCISGRQMNRLLQGDVGSGKTVVAIAAMLQAIDAGFQTAFMAPTEILAEQHYRSLRNYLDPLQIEVRLLVGGQKKAARREILAGFISGRTHIAVGTHALIEDKVSFNRLGLAVIDEQHRFGVMQRARMFRKGRAPHVLLMTATPIPRSLSMTMYGDLDVSVIREMPAGRHPVKTSLRYENKREDVYAFVHKSLEEGSQAYVVYPLVEESEKMDLKDAVSGYEQLQKRMAPFQVGLVHGRMSSEEKEAAMSAFKRGETRLLVATTVIEVGVDIPNATIMLIEHAERFGLSQLHQLRGRVGRGSEQSYCILMADFKRSPEAKIRLQAMVRTNDGFKISETDLRIRGAGDLFGTRQSGLPALKIADIISDRGLLEEARKAAFLLVERDPHLRAREQEYLRAHFLATAPKHLALARVG